MTWWPDRPWCMPARQPLSTQGSGLRIALAASVAAVAVLVLGLFSARALIHAKALQESTVHRVAGGVQAK